MSAEPQEVQRTKGPVLQVIEGGGATSRPVHREVVAQILSDGTVQVLGHDESGGDRAFAVGHVAGEGWTIWWDRRYW
jgi:hypothetical protein